ncbi:AcrR family transcriptional regulator [Arthrobacter silviterrae]|uniref:TetR/AcrR family transcriptional regulator n=1 Tax=Arthrobacter silviterrae TaxID=2026658 RepID=A0ABX0DFA2_9MICC|nr:MULTISPECIES: TetR family transcriptional regulator [Arthrobacter]MCU6480904.1 TetR family transcriptional regulator [Arthrobacter sp. A2-55]MDQ0279033.1 AcrR family transcriptional regulator [Arthrobacter silviterrae]NGN84450.1 TetR/AcrR family transcriptional regulator [Arthrobacter silviterrae]
MDTTKSAATRALVLETALAMFRSRGYAKTTMRAIAAEAGVSLGSAYYYFESKDQLVLELYRESVAEQHAGATAALDGATGLPDRLKAAIHAGLDALGPYHPFGGAFIASALPPQSSVNPFGEASRQARAEATAIFEDVVQGTKIPQFLRAQLPELLWLAYMGIVLFWVYDRSENQRRTRILVDGAAPLIGRLVSLSRLPVVKPLVEEALALKARVQA